MLYALPSSNNYFNLELTKVHPTALLRGARLEVDSKRIGNHSHALVLGLQIMASSQRTIYQAYVRAMSGDTPAKHGLMQANLNNFGCFDGYKHGTW